jgi:hypothetical protein
MYCRPSNKGMLKAAVGASPTNSEDPSVNNLGSAAPIAHLGPDFAAEVNDLGVKIKSLPLLNKNVSPRAEHK